MDWMGAYDLSCERGMKPQNGTSILFPSIERCWHSMPSLLTSQFSASVLRHFALNFHIWYNILFWNDQMTIMTFQCLTLELFCWVMLTYIVVHIQCLGIEECRAAQDIFSWFYYCQEIHWFIQLTFLHWLPFILGSSSSQGVETALFKKINFSSVVWETYAKFTTIMGSDPVEGIIKCSGLCNKRGCSMFKFSKVEGICSTMKVDPVVDWSDQVGRQLKYLLEKASN